MNNTIDENNIEGTEVHIEVDTDDVDSNQTTSNAAVPPKKTRVAAKASSNQSLLTMVMMMRPEPPRKVATNSRELLLNEVPIRANGPGQNCELIKWPDCGRSYR